MSRFAFVILLISVASCSVKQKESTLETVNKDKDTTIVFYDMHNHSRSEIAMDLDLLRVRKPKIVAILFVFDSLKDPLSDSLLSRSIRKAGNVILTAFWGGMDFNVTQSHSIFRNSAMGEGILSILQGTNGKEIHYVPLFETDTELFQNVSHLIASRYLLTPNNYVNNFIVGDEVMVLSQREWEDFVIVDSKSIDSSAIENKIVICGDIRSKSRMLITANIILNIYKSNIAGIPLN